MVSGYNPYGPRKPGVYHWMVLAPGNYSRTQIALCGLKGVSVQYTSQSRMITCKDCKKLKRKHQLEAKVKFLALQSRP